MSDDDENKPHHATARPPPGEEDVYSASTVVGEASDEILAIIRGDKAPAAPSIPKNLDIAPEAKVEAKAETKSAEPEPAREPEPKVEAKPQAKADDAKPPPPANDKPAYKSTPLEVPVTRLDAEPEAEPETQSKSESKPPSSPPLAKKGGLPPALGIVLFFVAVVAVLAALIR